MRPNRECAEIGRRVFLITVGALPAAAMAGGERLKAAATLGKLQKEDGVTPIEGAAWYVAEATGDGLEFRFPAGTLAKMQYIASDMLLDGAHLAVFQIRLHEAEKGRVFRFSFGALNQCSFRMRLPLEVVDQRSWMLDREGAFLKPICGGDRVDLDKVDRMTLTVSRKGPNPVRWAMTEPLIAAEVVPKIEKVLLPKGKLLDELGQSTLHTWPGKTKSIDEMRTRVRRQFEMAVKQVWPANFSRWGGWRERKLEKGTGFFGTHHDGKRWWLVDPDGYLFWSAGLDCVRVDAEARIDGIESALTWMPDPNGEFKDAYRGADWTRNARVIHYLAANMIRAFGAEGWREKWAKTALAEMRRLRFNTVGNWSEWQFAANAGFPYVRPMSFRANRAKWVYRDFPDVYDAGFEKDAADYASVLTDTVKDPAFIGYFLMNEPNWAFSTELPAAGMLYNTETCATREELARFLRQKHEGDAALAASWKTAASFDKVARGRWQGVLTKEALVDLRAFSVRMVERYFRMISAETKKVDPNHLNLGMRWAGVPPEWAVEGMKYFNVYSLNCYRPKLPLADAEKIGKLLNVPVMVGEWHFGALDVGLPASGIGHLKNQVDRAKAYRVYLEDCAADPYCVGAHWFTLYDQSALGRFDGENYNIGFLDICNRPYDEMGRAAIASHERMYAVADGKETAFAEAPEYLPLLFL